MASILFYFILLLFLEMGEGQEERERENLNQALCPAWSPGWGLIPQP